MLANQNNADGKAGESQAQIDSIPNVTKILQSCPSFF
jgi:hypothetical protein